MVNPKRRKVTKVGIGLFKGGEGKKSIIIFRGKRYWLFRQEWRKRAIEVAKKIKRDGYDIRLVNATFDGSVLDIYTNPQMPRIPHYKAKY